MTPRARLPWVAFLGALSLPAAASAEARTDTYTVEHPRYGNIGIYVHTADDADGVTRIASQLRIVIRKLGIVVYRKDVDQDEVFSDKRLVSFHNTTNTNGHRIDVRGESRENKFVVTSPSGTMVAPGDVAPFDLWSLKQADRCGDQAGKPDTIRVTGGETVKVSLHAASAPARHFHVGTGTRPTLGRRLDEEGCRCSAASRPERLSISSLLHRQTKPPRLLTTWGQPTSPRTKSALMTQQRITFIALCIGLAGCASVPTIDQSIGPLSAAAAMPEIIGARGPLTAQQSKALLEHLSTEPGDAGRLQRHLAIEAAVAESALIAGNHTQLLRDGPASFRAMFSAIQAATSHINLEYFIFEDVESDGMHLGDLLVAKREAGIAVNVIYDSFGSSATPAAFFDRLKKAGANVVQFNPVNPLVAKAGYSPNQRDHRKILIADGATAIMGGVNLSTTYQSNQPATSGTKPALHWRDTAIQIDGPAVAQLQTLFLDTWGKQKGLPIQDATMFPRSRPRERLLRVSSAAHATMRSRYYVTLCRRCATPRGIIVSARPFVPTAGDGRRPGAARRGVDVGCCCRQRSKSPR